MIDRRVAVDGRAGSGDHHRRRDWLIASGSVIWFVGVVSPLYLAWRDGRRRWLAACAVLVAASVASIPLAATATTANVGAAVELVAWLAGIAAAVTLAATSDSRPRQTRATWAASVRARWEMLYEIGEGVFGIVVCATLVLLLLMGLGLGVHALSQLLGTPLPYVHDDPNRVEWGGVAELVGYGLFATVALYLLFVLGLRVLRPAARRRVGGRA